MIAMLKQNLAKEDEIRRYATDIRVSLARIEDKLDSYAAENIKTELIQ